VGALDGEPADGVVDILRTGRERLGSAARCSAPQSAVLLAAVCTIVRPKTSTRVSADLLGLEKVETLAIAILLTFLLTHLVA